MRQDSSQEGQEGQLSVKKLKDPHRLMTNVKTPQNLQTTATKQARVSSQVHKSQGKSNTIPNPSSRKPTQSTSTCVEAQAQMKVRATASPAGAALHNQQQPNGQQQNGQTAYLMEEISSRVN